MTEYYKTRKKTNNLVAIVEVTLFIEFILGFYIDVILENNFHRNIKEQQNFKKYEFWERFSF